MRAAADYRIERRVCAGDDLLFCLRGRGQIQTHGKEFVVGSGQLGWINGSHPHAHWADPADPWELLWLRLDGAPLPAIAHLLHVDSDPVLTVPKPSETERILRRILRRFQLPDPALDAVLFADVAALLVCLFRAPRCEVALMHASAADWPPGIRQAIEQLGLYHYRQWTVDQLAQLAGLSAVQFFRSFRKATGMSPMQYLHRQRMNHAQRRLVEGRDSVKEIAEQVGYLDQFHFSRDFKRWTGVAPKFFRARELGDR
jgi:AraC-like DNA-binding protein